MKICNSNEKRALFQFFNYDYMKREVSIDDDWPEKAVSYFTEMVNEATSVRFTPRYKNLSTSHYFGDLNVTTFAGKVKSCSIKLIKHGLATMSTDFGQGE